MWKSDVFLDGTDQQATPLAPTSPRSQENTICLPHFTQGQEN